MEFLEYSNTTLVSINQPKENRIYSNRQIQIQLLFLLIQFVLGYRTLCKTIQIQLLFLLIPIFINISFFIIVSKILLFKDIKKFYQLILTFISYIKK